MVDSRSRCGNRNRTRSLASNKRPGQRLSSPGNRPAALLDTRQPPHLPLRTRRLGTSLLRPHHRRSSNIAHSRRIRSRARSRQPRSRQSRLELQPGRHRSPSHLAASRRQSRLKQLTHGDGIEVFPVMTASGSVAVLRADARIPIRPAFVATNGELRDLAPQLVPAEYPANKLSSRNRSSSPRPTE